MNRCSSAVDREALAIELAKLPALKIEVLRGRWRELYGPERQMRVGRRLLVRAIAHRLQEQALGGLKPAIRRWLERAASDLAGGSVPGPPACKILPGTRLLREWQGVTFEVLVVEDGVLFKGRHCRSLSEVARLITGSRWSGPLFFGLKAKNQPNAR